LTPYGLKALFFAFYGLFRIGYGISFMTKDEKWYIRQKIDESPCHWPLKKKKKKKTCPYA